MILALLTLTPTSCKHKEASVLSDISSTKYQVGDQWTYRTRPGEGNSTLTIGKVETTPKLGVIVHISLAGLRIKNAHAPTGYSDTIAHMPFAEAALDKSVMAKVTSAAVSPTFMDGYGEWRRAFDDGKAGVFTITVSEGVDFMEQVLNR